MCPCIWCVCINKFSFRWCSVLLPFLLSCCPPVCLHYFVDRAWQAYPKILQTLLKNRYSILCKSSSHHIGWYISGSDTVRRCNNHELLVLCNLNLFGWSEAGIVGCCEGGMLSMAAVCLCLKTNFIFSVSKPLYEVCLFSSHYSLHRSWKRMPLAHLFTHSLFSCIL